MVKNVTTLGTSRNKNLNGQHCFLPFKVANIIMQFANNNLNQLQTKVNTNKHDKWKQIPTYKSYNKKITCKKEMIQTPYLKGGGYCKH
jgi:hypothetical protein